MQNIQQITKEQAVAIADSKMWENWSDADIVRFQLFQDRLAMPWSRFQEAVEKVLDRPVFTHEFAFRDQLVDEYLGKKEKPTFDEIIKLIPEEKRIVVGV